MRWTPGGVSQDIEDDRDSGGGGGFGFGGGGARVGLGGLLVAAVLSVIFGRDFISPLLFNGGGTSAPRQVDQARDQSEEPLVKFVSFVLDDTQNTWHKLLGDRYRNARLVLFRDAIQSGCGAAESATGPFYCPADQKVYIDLGFYDELARRFKAPGEFAQAYVLAHEVGHHVQNLLGISTKVRRLQQSNPSEQNELSVGLELQADCLAGVWGHTTQERGLLEKGEVEQGLAAAAAVGDDRLQRQARGYVTPETFTHGSSAQRTHWFTQGFQTGDIKSCDTFAQR